MIEVTQDVQQITIVAEQGGYSVTLQPVLVVNGGGGGSVSWGGITGTLVDQIDLKNQQTAQDVAIALNTAKTGVTPESATYSATSTAVTTLDLDVIGDSHRQLLTVNTDIQWSNIPTVGITSVRTLDVSGAFSLTFTTSTKVIGTYVDDGTTINLITVNFAFYPTEGLRITVLITQ
jgi:hypothetical protein